MYYVFFMYFIVNIDTRVDCDLNVCVYGLLKYCIYNSNVMPIHVPISLLSTGWFQERIGA